MITWSELKALREERDHAIARARAAEGERDAAFATVRLVEAENNALRAMLERRGVRLTTEARDA